MATTWSTKGPPGVNFTNILWAAFAPKSFCQKITNPNCNPINGAQRTLVWKSCLSIVEINSHTKVLCPAFKCLQFGFVIFWRKDFGAKAAHKMLVKLTPGKPISTPWPSSTALSRWEPCLTEATGRCRRCQCYRAFFFVSDDESK